MLSHEKPWDKNLQLLVVFIVAFNLAPHVTTMPLWVSLTCAVCIIWKAIYLTRGFQLPKRWILAVATGLGALGVFMSFSTLLGQEAASALLVVMASLKLLETNRYRDAMLVTFTSYFLLMAHLLTSQSLATTVYLLFDVLLISTLMFQIHRRDRKSSSQSIRTTARLLALTLPLWAIFFFLFPRFSTAAWSLKPPEAGVGFSDDLDPGAISRLVDSDQTAFRVRFLPSQPISPDRLYWRGAILTNGDGLKWSRTVERRPESDVVISHDAQAKLFDYEVFLETGFQKWLFALDTPISLRTTDLNFLAQIRRSPGFIYESTRSVYSRIEYRARSLEKPPLQTLPLETLAQMKRLPADLPSQISELANKLKLEADLKTTLTPAERYSKRILDWYSERGFRYSKSPGASLSSNGSAQLSEFLFGNRLGFCEHYAASFATMMRAMGIASRVVVGFQGGSPNDLGGYLIVRRLDAHAWTEIWEPDDEANPTVGRWIRKDPTETIAPLRLQLGGDYNRMDNTILSQGLNGEELRRRLDSGFAGVLHKSQLVWDLMQMEWNSFLLRYDLEYQMELLARLGIAASPLLLLVTLMLVTSLFAVALIWLLRRNAARPDQLLEDWQEFCRKLERHGVNRALSEGPLDYAQRAALRFPEQRSEIERIAHSYAELRYGNKGETEKRVWQKIRQHFRYSVRRFSMSSSSRPTDS
jgi:transglutaminase-like putative cysteine protease